MHQLSHACTHDIYTLDIMFCGAFPAAFYASSAHPFLFFPVDYLLSEAHVAVSVYFVVVFFPATLVAYYLFHLERAPYTNRLRMIDMPIDKERAMGESYYNYILSSQRILPKNHPCSQLVSRVGMEIAKVC